MKSGGRLYRIPKAPFEPMAQVCERGDTIIKLAKNEPDSVMEIKKNEWIHASFINCYEKQGMRYDAFIS
jgi:hypothetical protein